jgi:DNA-directed RNA polymerase subunit E'/Rpb7
MVGKVCDCDHTGVQVSVGFFQHIIIPAENLRQPAFYDKEDPEKPAWYWQYEDSKLYLDKGEEIRFIVTSVEFTKPKATAVETKALSATGIEIRTIVCVIPPSLLRVSMLNSRDMGDVIGW